MEFSNIIGVIAADLEEVESVIDENIKSPVPLAYEISKYILGSGGKRLRPSVLILSSGACGLDNGRNRISSAAALELIHTASLLHDDVIDHANLRRGKTSSNIMWGNQASVLVGDFMLSRALQLVQSCESLELMKIITEATARLAEGQVLEVMSTMAKGEVSEEICFAIIKFKTASLLESCGIVGAIIAGASEEAKRLLGLFGLNVGIAFQLIDDALDYTGDEKEIGKGVGQDLIEKKVTLPLVYALREASSVERSNVMEILQYENPSERDISYIIEVVDKYEGVNKTKAIAKDYIDKAKEVLEHLPQNNYKTALILLADYILERRT